MQELGLQASHHIATQENRLEALKDISGNFPSRAHALSSLRVPLEFKKSVAQDQKLLQSILNLDEGEGAFLLQGRLAKSAKYLRYKIDERSFNLNNLSFVVV